MRGKRLFIIFALLFISINLSAEKLRVYVKDLSIQKGVSKSIASRIKDNIVLSIFKNFGDKYRIVSDEDINIMYQQASHLMAIGCDAEKCVIQIAYSIDADEIIYGSVSSRLGKIHLKLFNLKRNRKTDTFYKKSVVILSFYPSQVDWFAQEAGKKLIKPSYRIIPSKAPSEINLEFSISELKLPRIQGIDIDIFKFRTTDSTIARIIDYLKSLVKKGDDDFNSKNFSSALDNYFLVINKIKTKLPASKQKKLASFTRKVKDRIVSAYAMLFKQKIESIDEIVKKGKIDEGLKSYNSILAEFEEIEPEYKKRLNKIKQQIYKRKDEIYRIRAMKYEKEGDIYYTEYRFEEAIKKYEQAMNELGNLFYKKAKENIKLRKRIEKKIEIAEDTGESYFRNRVQSYCDWIDYYNISEQEEKAMEVLKKLRSYILSSKWGKNKEEILKYNERARIVGGEQIISVKIWDKTFGGGDDDKAYSIQQTSDGGYIIAGYTESKGAGKGDVWVIKIKSVK